MEYKLDITINSDKEHHPITLSTVVPEDVGRLIMATPVTSVTLAIGRVGFGEVAALPLLDYKAK